MLKLFRFFIPFILFTLIFSGCRKQPPTPVSDTDMGGSLPIVINGGIVPDRTQTGWGMEGPDLELRASTASIDDVSNTYNGRAMARNILQDVYFAFDSSSISAMERSKLQEAANYLVANPSHGLLIEGYCDWYGTEEYNLALGDRRANSARDYLATLGIDPKRIETLSKGSLEATRGLSKSESGKDRRDVFIIIK